MQLKKIPFKIEESSGSDPNHTPQELLMNTPFATGWQSERFCSFPQHLTLRLIDGPFRIFKIQLLIHHFKIPTKIELSISIRGISSDFQKLGYVSIADNSQNQYKARELKTVHIDSKTDLIQIKCYKCHVNPLNLYNQVGIVAISILGSDIDHSIISPSSVPQTGNAVTRGIIERSFADDNTAIDSDLSYMDHDRFIVQSLSLLASNKKDAVRREDYQLAKKLKALQQLFNEASAEVLALLSEKRRALEHEDYDKAQDLQKTVEAKRDNLKLQMKGTGIILHNYGMSLGGENREENYPAKEQSQTNTESINDIPIKSKYALDAEKSVESRPSSSNGRESASQLQISLQDQEEYANSIKIFGFQCVACILSNSFTFREKGMKLAEKVLADVERQNDEDQTVEASFQILKLVILDSREKSHALMIALLSSLVDFCFRKNYSPSTVVNLLADITPTILNKTSDLNPRIRKRSLEQMMNLCAIYHSNTASVLALVTKPFVTTKVQNLPWKHIKARLDISIDLVKKYGLMDGKPSSENGWSSEMIFAFSKPFLSHSNADVRESATVLLAETAVVVPNLLVSLSGIPQSANDAIQKKFKLTVKKAYVDKEETSNIDNEALQEEDIELNGICIFCGLGKGLETEEALDSHYWRDCPALYKCDTCNNLVEISDKNMHKIQECVDALDFQECPKCKMAIRKSDRKEHLADPISKGKTDRCALCFQDCRHGLLKHLVERPGCPESERKYIF